MQNYIKMLKKMISKAKIYVLGGVAFTGEKLIATDLESAVVVDYKSDNQGVVSNFEAVLDRPELFDTFKMDDLAQYPDLPKYTDKGFGELKDIDKLFEAVKTVSKDKARPSLMYVHISDGYIDATDGYSMYRAKTENEGVIWFSPLAIELIKISKQTNWEYKVENDTLFLRSDGVMILDKQLYSAYPDLRMCEPRGEVIETVSFDYKQFKAEMKKLNASIFKIQFGEIYAYPNYESGQGKLPESVKIEVKKVEEKPSSDVMRVFMPRSDGSLDIKILEKISLPEITLKVYNSGIAEVC